MSETGIVNIINFIRAVEPREPAPDLLEPVARQIALVQQHQLPATWLLQYDALMDDRFLGLLRERLDGRQEIGGWLEIVQPQVEQAGIPWRGRFPWDWHAHVGFSIGYTPSERERLVDVFMEGFRARLGTTPTTVGSWFMDAHTLGYLADRWGVTASCVCKDQWGTDGYSMWGGYYGQAFYPSRRNAYMPAQTAEGQIPVPLFRMLGSDPIYQYDAGATENGQTVVTLEPVYPHGGGSPEWVRWFFDLTFGAPSLSFGYAQVGQENSFGWPAMAVGLTDQIELAAVWAAQGKLRVETLGESARWFRERYPVTPASAISALSDWQGEGRRSVWYCSRHYRANLYWEGEQLWFRDIHRFDERYAERYLETPCPTPDCEYDTLPVVDAYLWGGHWSRTGRRAGLLLQAEGAPLRMAGEPQVRELDLDTLEVWCPLARGGALRIVLRPEEILLESAAPGWELGATWDAARATALCSITERALHYRHEGFTYSVTCLVGRCAPGTGDPGVRLLPEQGMLVLRLAEQAQEG